MATVDEMIKQVYAELRSGRLVEVGWNLKKLVTRAPDRPEVLAILVTYDRMRGDRQASQSRLQSALQRYPASPALIEQLGMFFHTQGRPAEAVPHFTKALQLDPTLLDSGGLLAMFHLQAGRYEAARPLLEALVRDHPGDAGVWSLVGGERNGVGRLKEAADALNRALELDPHNPIHCSNRASIATYRHDITPPEVFEAHLAWQTRCGTSQPALAAVVRKPGRTRIGYVSGDFEAHSVSTFFEPLLTHHDRSRFEVFCYSDVRVPDAVTARLIAKSEHWLDISRLNHPAAAHRIADDDIDILIDLAGHTIGNRLVTFDLKPARVQATWLGYPNTTGLSRIDYRITDTTADPDENQAWHSERLLRLPGTFFCYTPPGDIAPLPVQEPPCVARGHTVFGVPTNITKVTPPMVRLWGQILNRLPGSRVSIKAAMASDPFVQSWIMAELTATGITADRVDFFGQSNFNDYLELHQHWDVILDSFPFNGHTTTCHALWMGIPTVTLCGQMHASRMGSSVLHALTLDDLIAVTPEDYVSLAASLAADIPRLTDLRRSLRDRMKSSDMMNGPKFAARFEALLTEITRHA